MKDKKGHLARVDKLFWPAFAFLVTIQLDTPLPKGERILGSTTSLKLATLQLLAQRCDLPKRLWVCPTLVGLLQVLFDWCKISTKGCLSSSSKYFIYCEVEARILQ
jgi:hypothetical protein